MRKDLWVPMFLLARTRLGKILKDIVEVRGYQKLVLKSIQNNGLEK